MPTSTDAVKTYLGLGVARPVDEDALQAAVDAANAAVLAYRPDITDTDPYGHRSGGAEWPPNVEQAATMWAARLYGRRGSVQGVAAFQDVGVSLLPRMDPDVRVLLQLGEYQPSVVA